MPNEINNYIVTERPLLIERKARAHAKGMMVSFYLGFVIIYLLLNWIPEIIGVFYPLSYFEVLSRFLPLKEGVIEQLPTTPLVVYVYAILMNGVFKLGKSLYTLTFVRNRRVEYSSIFEGFKLYFKALGLFIVQMLIVFIWSMLFIIPGIIAAINFSQSFYIFADNPEKGIMNILFESKMMMYGNRMTFIKLIIVYVPYLAIGYLPLIAASSLLNIDSASVLGIISLMLLNIPFYCASGYMELGFCTFYELLINHGFDNFRYSGQNAFRDQTITL